MIFISVIIAIVLVFGIGYFAPQLPFNSLMGGNFYQIVSVVLAVVISAVLNMPMLYMLKANSKYKKGEYKAAIALYKKAYGTKRLSADMEIYCGYIFLKEGEKELCEQVFNRVAKRKLTPYQKNRFDINYAILLWKKGRLDEAIDLLKTVWEKEQSVNTAGTLGALLLIRARKTGDYAEAVAFCEETNEQFTYERTIMANLGEAYYCVGRNDEALTVFAELMDCGSVAPAPYYYYALALLKADKKSEAAQMLNLSLRQRFSALSTVGKKTVKAKLAEITVEE